MDFIAVGDTVVDDFIRLKDASVHCDINNEACTISMPWGAKIPFESSTKLYGVGNAANAAVSAARLGLASGLLSNIGSDEYGAKVLEHFAREQVDASRVMSHSSVPTNYHYVLSYESERTILIKQNAYPYLFPLDMPAPKTLYFSSLSETAGAYRRDLGSYLSMHPEIFFTFQPGTFEIKAGVETLGALYARSDLFVCNKEEAETILGLPADQDPKILLEGLRKLGPKTVIVTNDRKGAYAYDGREMFMVPLYPDARPPVERTGAGDAFASTISVALTLGKPFREALLWGPTNSMSVVQKVGAQEGLLTRAAVEQHLAEAPTSYGVTPL